MPIRRILNKVGGSLFGRKAEAAFAPILTQPKRFPYGPFSFKAALPVGATYTVMASTNLTSWAPIADGAAGPKPLEYLDTDAPKFNHRFYRVVADATASQNAIGFVSITLAPGFSLIGNPLDCQNNAVSELFKEWPDGTSLNKFDTRLFRLSENEVVRNRWSRPDETLSPGDGAIFFNPTNDYKSHSFAGEVLQGNLAAPIPAGFSLRSSLVPLPGNLAEDLAFPISNGDVIHLFDRDQQKYVLYPFENGKWKNGAPVLSVGESFWTAKTEPANWSRDLTLS